MPHSLHRMREVAEEKQLTSFIYEMIIKWFRFFDTQFNPCASVPLSYVGYNTINIKTLIFYETVASITI